MFEAQRCEEKPGIIQTEHPGLRLRPYVTLRFVSVKLIALATRKAIQNVIKFCYILEANLLRTVSIS